MMDVSTRLLSDITVFLKYARYLDSEKRREVWDELTERNSSMHIRKFPDMAEEITAAYKRVKNREILPSMRSLQFGGKPIEISPNRQYNCAYAPIDHPDVFSEIMFLLLGGTGVGFSVQRHHVRKLPPLRGPIAPQDNRERRKRYLIGDSIEGWSDAIKALMYSYFEGTKDLEFDFRDIRPKGARLITSGGKAPGPQPLKDCIHHIRKVLDTVIEERGVNARLKPIEAHDIVCHIADAVLSGGIRRAALISLFSFDDEEMLSSKFGNWWELNPQRARANNSVVALRHRIKEEDFKELWEKIKASGSGEPGIFFTNDSEAGTNPCAEISLRPFQFCNLVTVNVSDVDSQETLNERVKAATFIATIQASYTEFHYLRDIWRETTEKEALLGVSMTGIASGKVLSMNLEEAAKVALKENERVAKKIGINKAARVTCVKPEGTASLVLGTSSGVHAWHSPYYIRRIRVGKNESIYQYLKVFSPAIVEDDYFKPETQAVISLPVKAPDGSVFREEPALDLLERVKKLHKEWILPGHRKGNNTHNTSCTVSVKKYEWDRVGEWMWKNRDCYNGISVLPYDDHTYVQTPFEECTKEQYETMMTKVVDIDLSVVREDDDTTNLSGELACAGGACEIA